MLHFQLPIYHKVAELQRAIFEGAKHVRRDVKPTLGRLLMEESLYASTLVRRANVASGLQRVAQVELLLEQLELVQLAVRQGRDAGLLMNPLYEATMPIFVHAGKQATGWKQNALEEAEKAAAAAKDRQVSP